MAFGISAGTYLMAGTALAGGMIASNSADDARESQERGAAQSDATQRYQYDTTRADNAPFRETGLAANNRLAQLMGLPSGGSLSREQIRNNLAGNFTTQATAGTNGGGSWVNNGHGDMSESWQYVRDANASGTPGMAGEVDEAGLNAAVERQWAEQQASEQAQQNDPSYGSLMRKFSQSDLNADPVYQNGLQFGLNEGTKGINRQAAAGGSMLSGATLKALTRFGNDYGSTKANESYNRFNTDQNSQYNKLAGLSGAGQQATNQVSAAGQNMANNISQSQQGVGNARGSAYLTQGNSWQNALNGGVSALNNSNAFGGGASQSPNFFDGTGAWRA